jgi:hypothetical protein
MLIRARIAGFLKQAAGLALALLCLGGIPVSGQDDKLLTWSDSSGNYKIEAAFVRIQGEAVILAKSDGSQITVPLEKLSLSSQLQARKAADPQAFTKLAPRPAAAPVVPLGESPFPPDPTLEQTLQIVFDSLKAKNPEVAWHALPAAWQSDIESVVIKAADLVGPTLLKQTPAVLKNVLTIVRDKQEFIVGSQFMADKPEVAEQARTVLPALVPIVEIFARSSTWSADNFKKGQVGPWTVKMLRDLTAASSQLEELMKTLPQANEGQLSLEDISFRVLNESGNSGMVELTAPGQESQEVAFTKVGNRWVPADLAAGWKEGIGEAQSQLAAIPAQQVQQFRAGAGMGLTFANGLLGSLASASTQAEFDAALDQILSTAGQGLNFQMQAGGGPGGPGGPGGQGRPGGPGFSAPPGGAPGGAPGGRPGGGLGSAPGGGGAPGNRPGASLGGAPGTSPGGNSGGGNSSGAAVTPDQ